MALDCVESIGWCIGIGVFWVQSLFRAMAGKGEMRRGILSGHIFVFEYVDSFNIF
jgi:hypothetical protein